GSLAWTPSTSFGPTAPEKPSPAAARTSTRSWCCAREQDNPRGPNRDHPTEGPSAPRRPARCRGPGPAGAGLVSVGLVRPAGPSRTVVSRRGPGCGPGNRIGTPGRVVEAPFGRRLGTAGPAPAGPRLPARVQLLLRPGRAAQPPGPALVLPARDRLAVRRPRGRHRAPGAGRRAVWQAGPGCAATFPRGGVLPAGTARRGGAAFPPGPPPRPRQRPRPPRPRPAG